MATQTMPMRGDRSAPTFDPAQPRTIRRYFEDLEMLFARCSITSDAEQKKYARMYVPIDVADVWESLPEYTSATDDYKKFKAAILALYPGAGTDRRWNRSDMFNLVAQAMRNGITCLEDWAVFYWNFLAVSTYLVSNNCCSTDEQGRKLLEVLPRVLLDKTLSRLQSTVPNQLADTAYAAADVNSAVVWVLSGGGVLGVQLDGAGPYGLQQPASVPQNLGNDGYLGPPAGPLAGPPPVAIQPPSQPTSPPTSGITIKPEAVQSLIDSMARVADTLARQNAQAMAAANQQTSAGHQPAATSTMPPPRPYQAPRMGCHYCDSPSHVLNGCPGVDEDIRMGKIVRGADGRISLPAGGMVPRSTPGNNLRERIENWHKAFPSQTVQDSHFLSQDTYDIYGDNGLNVFLGQVSETADPECLAGLERILVLEEQIQALRMGRKEAFDGVELPPPPHVRAKAQAKVASGPAEASPVTPNNAQAKPVSAPESSMPTHPFAHARDANRAPARPGNPRPYNAYSRLRAPVESDKLATSVYDKLFRQATVALTPEELLSISSDLRAKVRVAVTPKRADENEAPKATLENVLEEDASREGALWDLPPGVLLMPYELYEARCEDDNMRGGEGEGPALKVARESGPLRTIIVHVNNREDIECILDPGCQIVAMSERAALRAGVSWDPRYILRMQSANGQVNPSLGLARNVAFQFAGVTVLMQVHVIREAAYEVLLGRPFDDITRSVVKNIGGDGQTITIHDPNSRNVITIPTFARGDGISKNARPGF